MGLHGLAMERSCSLWWRGCSGTTVFPQTQRVRLVRLSLFGCDPATSISSPRTSHGKHRLRERTNRRLPRQPSKKYSKPMFRATFVTCSRTHQGMDTDVLERVTDGLENWVSPKKSHQRSQSTGCVPVRKAPTNPHSQASAPQVKVDGDGATNNPRDRVLMSSPLGQAVR